MTTVLVIDDDDDVRSVLQDVLTRNGYDVTGAADGNQGLEQLRRKTYDIVITDILMPEKEGIETIIELRKNWPKTRILAISGGGVGSAGTYLTLAEKLGAHMALTKPIRIQTLLDAMKKLSSKPFLKISKNP